MPPFKGQQSDEGVTAVIAYFKSLWSRERRRYQEEPNRRPSMPMQGRSQRPIGRAAGTKRPGRSRQAVALAVAVLTVGVAFWWAPQPHPEAAAGPAGLPGPLGGPDVAQDVNTLVGRPARTFVLSDSDGKSYTVGPGPGKPLVLVFHMGIV